MCKSTKQTEKTKALEFCLTIERATNLATEGNLTEIRAKQLISEIVERVGGDSLTFRSLQEFCNDWISSKQTTKAGGTTVRYRGIIEGFLSFIGDKKAKMNIASITPRDAEAFRDNEIREGKSESTANLALKTLRSIFSSARRQGLITSNPAEAVETFDAEKELREPFTNEQLKSLLAVADKEWKTMILLGYYTAARLSDCATMTWRNVDLVAKTLTFTPQKTKRKSGKLIVPIMPELETHLLSLPSSDKADTPLCPTLFSKGTGGNRGLSQTFTRLMTKAKVFAEQGEERKGKGRRFRSLGFHSLRHTNPSELANAGVPSEVRQKITGHKDEAVHAGYTHLQLETSRKALKKLPRIGKATRSK